MQYINESFQNGLSEYFVKFRNENSFFDFKVDVDGRQLYAHKSILCAAIPSSVSQLSTENELLCEFMKILQAMSYENAECILNFVYTAEILITEANVCDILIASNKLKLDSLSKLCLDYVRNRLSIKNLDQIWKFSKKYEIQDLQCLCKMTFIRHFDEFLESEMFQSLTETDLKTYLKSDVLGVKDESVVYHAIIAWMGEKPERQNSCFALFQQIRPSFLPDALITDALLRFPSCKKQLTKTNSPSNPRMYKCPDAHVVFALGFKTAAYEGTTLDRLNSEAKTWNVVRTIDSYTFGTVAFVGNEIVACGDNRRNDTPLEHFETFNFVSGNTGRIPAWQRHHYEPIAVEVAGKLVILDSGNASEIYDPQLRTWSNLPAFPENQFQFAAVVVFNRYILAIGQCWPNNSVGISRAMYLDVFSIDHLSEPAGWREMTPMLSARSSHTAMELHGRVFVAGGRVLSVNVHDVEMFTSANDFPLCSDRQWTPERGQWTRLENLNHPSSYRFISAGYGDRLYVGFNFCDNFVDEIAMLVSTCSVEERINLSEEDDPLGLSQGLPFLEHQIDIWKWEKLPPCSSMGIPYQMKITKS